MTTQASWFSRARRRSGIALFSLGAGVTSLALFGCDRSDKPDPGVVQAEAPLPAIKWSSAERLRYAYELESRTTVGKARMNRLSVKGELLVQPREAGKGQWELLFEISKSVFKREPGGEEEDYRALEAELNGARGSVTLAEGVLSAQRLHQDASPVVANLIRTLMSQWQYPGARAKKEVEEYDSTGRYQAKYEVLSQDHIKKTKERYLALSARGIRRGSVVEAPLPEVDRSEINYEVRDGRIVSVTGTEAVKSLVNDAVALSSGFETQLRFLDKGPKQAWGSDFLDSARDWPVEQAHVDNWSAAEFDATRIGEFSYDEAVSTLVRIQEESGGAFASVKKGVPVSPSERVATESQLEEYQHAFAALAAIFRRDETATERAYQDVILNKPFAKLLVDALASSGGKEAQARLVKLVLDEKVALELRGDAAFGLARADHPIDAVIPTLAGITGHPRLGEYGLFGLGTLVRRLAESGDKKRAEEVSALLRKELQGTSAVDHRVRVLNAMSNSGDETLFSAVAPHLSAAEESVAVAAVNALRLMEGNAPSHALSEALASPNRRIRAAALRAMKHRSATSELVSALASLVKTSPSPSEAVDAVGVLASWLKTSPAARQALQQLAAAPELEGRVQEAVRSALSS